MHSVKPYTTHFNTLIYDVLFIYVCVSFLCIFQMRVKTIKCVADLLEDDVTLIRDPAVKRMVLEKLTDSAISVR